MVLPRLRSKSRKRVFARSTSGRRLLHFKNEAPKRMRCRICKARLSGTNSVRGLAKSKKVPSRKFAGELCPSCTAEIIVLKTRISAGMAKECDASLAQRKYLE